jgi:hypothetical protein
MQKMQSQPEQGSSHPGSPSPPQFMGTPQMAYASQLQMAQMNPMMQMASFMNPQAMQSLMRNPSPGAGQPYMGSFSS